jgi:WD40 repeat protein
VNSLQFSSGSRFLVTGGADGYARVWDLKTQEVKQSYHVSASPVTSVAFSGFKDDYIVAASQRYV